MTGFFIILYRYFQRHRLVFWLSMIGMFVFFGYFACQIHLEEDINKLMPSSRNEDGTMKMAFANLKIKDKTFLLFSLNSDPSSLSNLSDPSDSSEKSDYSEYSDYSEKSDYSDYSEKSDYSDNSENSYPSELIQVCDALIDSLRQDSALIEDIFYQLPEDLLDDAVDYAERHFPAYIDTTAYAQFDSLLTREHFLRQMEQNRDDLTGEFGEMFPELIEMDPMGMRNVLAKQVTALMSTDSYKTIDGHFFVPDSTVCLAFITPRFSSTNTGQGSALFERLNALIAQFKVAHPAVTISYHGTPASGYYNSRQIKHDLTTTIAGALVLVLVFLLFCFRRWDTIPLLILPVVFGTIFGLTLMYWLKGEFSLLALGIGGVVLGVALSYVLHVMTHHQYVSDTEQLLRDQVKPVSLGCLTTIGSFAGLIFIKTDLLQDFGLFAAFAILGTTIFSLAFLPQLLPARKGQFPAIVERISGAHLDRSRPLIIAIVVVMVVCLGAYFVGGTRFDADMHNLGYEEPLTKHSEQLLREKTYTGDKQRYFASQGQTMEEAIGHFADLDRKLDSLQQMGLVKEYTHTDQIFVSQRRQQERIDAWKRYWNAERLKTVRQLIAETAPKAGLRPEAFETFFEAATADYEPDALYETGLIPEGYQSTLMEQSYDGKYLCFTSVRCQNDSVRSSESDYIRICDAVAKNPNLLVLDTYYYTTDTLMRMNGDFNVLQWLSMAFVFLVLLVSFLYKTNGNAGYRFNWRHTLLGFMPILLSWMIVLGAMVLCGVSFNLISIIISTFIFGIGVDYSIFVMNGLTAPNTQKLTYHKTAILLSAVTLIVTVSSMLMAQHPAIRSVGFSTLVGLLSAIILSYVLQPAAYRWLNRNNR